MVSPCGGRQPISTGVLSLANNNGGAGFSFSSAKGNTLEKNRPEENGGAGFSFSSATGNTLKKNRSEENGGAGFILNLT